MNLHIGNEPFQRAASCFVRMTVFVLERNIKMDDEFDNLDLPDTVYGVLYDGNLPVSTARLIAEDEKTVRLTRVATLKEYRGKQYGSQVIRAVEKYAVTQNFRVSIIHAEVDALPFYLKLGYETISEVYYEDGEPCQTLKKYLV